MHLSEWQMKPVINLADGTKLGVICDMDVDPRTGRVIAMLVCPQLPWWNRWRDGGESIWISWPHVLKIGADVILVRMDAARQAQERQDVIE